MQPGYKFGANYMHVIQSLGLCKLAYWGFPNGSVLMSSIKAVTGWDVTYDELFLAGERIANIRHLFCLREGISMLDQSYPDRMAGRPPIDGGPLKGVTVDEERIVSEFLDAMDWDRATTMPSAKKLEELGLLDLASDICK
jgi:aldehyde:ferredoxin oxidoreductase